MRKLLFTLALLLFYAPLLVAQPGIPLTAGIGVPGSAPTLCAALVVMPSDADFTMTAAQYACNSLRVTSSTSLTATRNVIAPLNIGQQFTVTNATTGGQSILVKGASGSGVTVSSGQTLIVASPDGASYVLTGSAGTGTVTSVALTMPSALFTTPVPGSPVTSAGTLSPALASQAANCFFASPNGSSGTPTCRAMVAADVPSLATIINSVNCTTNTGTNCVLPNACAGVTCPNGSQISVVFTTSTNLLIAATVNPSDTTMTVTTTTGFPAVGCGQFVQGGVQEFFCWSSIDATHLLGLARGLFGTGAQTWTYPVPGAAINGIIYSQARSTATTQIFYILNNGSATFTGNVGAGSFSSSGATIAGAASINTLVSAWYGPIIIGAVTPTMAPGAAAGTSPSCTTVTGTNQFFTLTCTTGTATAAGTLATITFSSATPAAARGCDLFPLNAATASQVTSIYTTAPSTTSWTVGTNSALPISTTFSWSGKCF